MDTSLFQWMHKLIKISIPPQLPEIMLNQGMKRRIFCPSFSCTFYIFQRNIMTLEHTLQFLNATRSLGSASLRGESQLKRRNEMGIATGICTIRLNQNIDFYPLLCRLENKQPSE